MTISPQQSATPRELTVLAGRYRVERQLGRGGMATVFLCTDLTTNDPVALKKLRKEVANAVTVERFTREIEFISTLEHPRIPAVLGSGVLDGVPFYVMTYIDGEQLRARLMRDVMLPVREAVEIAVQVTEPMAYAHAQGIIHRDIKPENILLSGNGVCVLDFGIARALIEAAGERLTATGVAIGTPAYMSPEQALGHRDLDSRSDMYALGCVLYEMLAGSPPFDGPNPQARLALRFAGPPKTIRTIRPEVPAELEAVVMKVLQREPNKRFNNATEFGEALRASV